MAIGGDFYSANAHIVERFVPLDSNTIRWTMTIKDLAPRSSRAGGDGIDQGADHMRALPQAAADLPEAFSDPISSLTR